MPYTSCIPRLPQETIQAVATVAFIDAILFVKVEDAFCPARPKTLQAVRICASEVQGARQAFD